MFNYILGSLPNTLSEAQRDIGQVEFNQTVPEPADQFRWRRRPIGNFHERGPTLSAASIASV